MLHHATHGADHTVHAESVRDESRHILRDDDAFAECAFGKLPHRADHCRIGVIGRNDFQQMHVARRIEEVRAKEPATELLAPSFEQRCHRNAGCVRRNDHRRLHQRFDARKELLLGCCEFDDCFADPVALSQPLEMIFGVARANTRNRRRFHERGRFGLGDLLQAVFGGRTAVGRLGVLVARDIEQHDAAASRCGKGGDPAPHRSSADHADGRHTHFGSPEWTAKRFREDRREGRGRAVKMRRFRHVIAVRPRRP